MAQALSAGKDEVVRGQRARYLVSLAAAIQEYRAGALAGRKGGRAAVPAPPDLYAYRRSGGRPGGQAGLMLPNGS